jgi:hypothetical protein
VSVTVDAGIKPCNNASHYHVRVIVVLFTSVKLQLGCKDFQVFCRLFSVHSISHNRWKIALLPCERWSHERQTEGNDVMEAVASRFRKLDIGVLPLRMNCHCDHVLPLKYREILSCTCSHLFSRVIIESCSVRN